MRKKILMCMFLAMLVASVMFSRGYAADVTTTAVSPSITQNMPVGSVFFINLTVSNIQKLWGYQYVIRFNSTVLEALNFTNLAYLLYSEFTLEEQSGIAAGNVSASFHAPMGDGVGLTTTNPAPLLEIAFKVKAEGTSRLTIDTAKTGLVNIYGDAFIVYGGNLQVSDGYFSTTAFQVHDIVVTGVTVSSTSAKVGDKITIDVAFKNDGDFAEDFAVSVAHNTTTGTFTEIDRKAVTGLAVDASSTLSFTWDTTGLGEAKYVVRATASVTDEAFPINNVRDSSVITLGGSGGGGFSINPLYIVAGVVIIVVIVAAVVLLRRRH